jgi:hypothetical protein
MPSLPIGPSAEPPTAPYVRHSRHRPNTNWGSSRNGLVASLAHYSGVFASTPARTVRKPPRLSAHAFVRAGTVPDGSLFTHSRQRRESVSPARAPSGGVAPLPGATQQRTERPHTTNAFRSRWLANGTAWDRIPVSRISKSNGHGERDQYDRKSLEHSVFLPRPRSHAVSLETFGHDRH